MSQAAILYAVKNIERHTLITVSNSIIEQSGM